ncbi:YobA family protein [Lysinibacillus sp. CTST325]
MSKVDVRVLNDLTESKKRVMSNVVQHLERREMKKRSWRWQYSVMSVILTVCIGIFLYTQFSGSQEQSASIPTVLDEKLLKFSLEIDPQVKDPKLSSDEKLEFESYLQGEALYAYARSKGIVPTQEQVDKELETWIELSINENNAKFTEQLQKMNLTREEYIEQYTKPMTYQFATINSLLEQEKNQYKVEERLMLFFLVKKDALNYFEEHYSQEIAYLREKYDIPVKEKGSRSKRGLVVAIKEHEFLVVSYADASSIGKLTTDEIVEKHGNGMWFPLIDPPKTLSPGDYVEVKYNQDLNIEGENIVRIADIESMEILEEHQ